MIRRKDYEWFLRTKGPVWGDTLNVRWDGSRRSWLLRQVPDWLVFGAIGVALGLLASLLILSL